MKRARSAMRALLLAAAVAVAAAAPPGDGPAGTSAAASYQAPILSAETNRGLRPTRLQAYGRTHYYALAQDPVGTLVFFHGCARSARGFFPYDPVHCPECLGFPEDVAATKQALARGYAFLALEPNDARHLCWSSSVKPGPGGGYVNDQPDVIATVSQFLQANGLADKPLFLAGASSGGTLALKLPATLYVAEKAAGALSLEEASALALNYTGPADGVGPLGDALAAAASVDVGAGGSGVESSPAGGFHHLPASVAAPAPGPSEYGPGAEGAGTVNATAAKFFLQISGIIAVVSTPSVGEFATDSQGRLRWPNFPPTLFVTMERDSDSQVEGQRNVDLLRKNGVPSGMIVSPVREVTPTYLSDRSPVISPEQSALIVAALKQIGLLDEDGLFQDDPHAFDKPSSVAYQWSQKLKRALPWVGSGPLSLVFRTSGIHQALLVAYGKHEHVSDFITGGLAWLESKGQASLGALARRLVVPDFNLTALTADRRYPADPSAVGSGTQGRRRPPPPTVEQGTPPAGAPPPASSPPAGPVRQGTSSGRPSPASQRALNRSAARFFGRAQQRSPPRPPSPLPSPAPPPPSPAQPAA